MFSKIKSTVVWGALLSIPVAAVVFTVRYFMNRKSNEPIDAEEIAELVTSTVAFAKKVFRLIG